MNYRAILLKNDLAKRLIGKKYEIINTRFDITGRLVEFTMKPLPSGTNIDYLYVFSNLLDGTGLEGYCKRDAYEKYRNKEIKLDEFRLMSNWFDKQFESAVPGDIFEIEKVDFYNFDGTTKNYTAYYHKFKYAFKINKIIDFYDTAQYPKPFNVITDENDPNYSVKTDISLNLLNTITGRFYTKNFGGKVGTLISSGVVDSEIAKTAYLILKISFKIFWILHDEILDKIAIQSRATLITAVYHNYSLYANNKGNAGNTYNTLSYIDKVVADILHDWGAAYESHPLPELEPKDFFQGLNLTEMSQYLNTLVNLYNNLYGKREDIIFPLPNNPDDNLESTRRFKQLLELLSEESLGILPIPIRLQILDEASEMFEIFENDKGLQILTEGNVLKILNSFIGYNEINTLLDYLAELKIVGKVKKTRFELLFRNMDDTHFYQNLDTDNWFSDSKDNRKTFTFLIYRHWKTSKYNFNYIPPGVTPNADGLNPNAFFLDESPAGGNKYYAKYDQNGNIIKGSDPILEFSVQDRTSEGNMYYYPLSEEISYETEKALNEEKVVVKQKTSNSYVYSAPGPMGGVSGVATSSNSEKYGEYHIYQPISILGYQANMELTIPQVDLIPAFLFYYAVDFDKLKDIDAGIEFGLQVALEVGLFFATGGVSVIEDLRYLRYLKYVTNINKARELAIPATEAVLFWRGLEAGSQVVSVTASIFTSYFTYRSATTNDPALAELNKKISYFFLALTFATAGSAIYSRNRTVKSAKEVVAEIDHLTSQSIPHQLPADVKQVIDLVAGETLLKATLTINKIGEEYAALAVKLNSIKNVNLMLADELAEILQNSVEAATKAKFNGYVNILDTFDDLAKVPKFKEFANFYDKYYELARLQKERKGWAVFLEADELITTQPLHTMEQVYDMMQYGHNIGLSSSDDIFGLIAKSNRVGKQVSSTVVKEWMDNYKAFLDNLVPYAFDNATHFNLFKNQIEPLLTKYKLGNRITIGGSTLTKIPPPDLDLVLYLGPDKYDAMLAHYENVFAQIKAYRNIPGNSKYLEKEIKGLEEAFQLSRDLSKGKFDTRCLLDFKVLPNGKPSLNRFVSEMKGSSFMNNLNVTAKKKLDFSIFRTVQGNRAVSVPPEYNINF